MSTGSTRCVTLLLCERVDVRENQQYTLVGLFDCGRPNAFPCVLQAAVFAEFERGERDVRLFQYALIAPDGSVVFDGKVEIDGWLPTNRAAVGQNAYETIFPAPGTYTLRVTAEGQVLR